MREGREVTRRIQLLERLVAGSELELGRNRLVIPQGDEGPPEGGDPDPLVEVTHDRPPPRSELFGSCSLSLHGDECGLIYQDHRLHQWLPGGFFAKTFAAPRCLRGRSRP